MALWSSGSLRRVAGAAIAALGLVFGVASIAGADTDGVTGRIVALRVWAPTSDDYPAHHGEIVVGDSIGGFATYYWGGSFCPGKTLDQPLVEMLQRGLDNPRIVLRPRVLNGQGGNQCVVAFQLILRNEQGFVP
jgi:hypothetical protein